MITESEVYWITRLDDVRWFFGGIAIFGVFASVVFGVVCLACSVEQSRIPKTVSRTALAALFAAVLSSLAVVFFPSTSDAAMIKVIPMIANSKFVSEDLPADARQIYDLGKKALVEKLKGQGK